MDHAVVTTARLPVLSKELNMRKLFLLSLLALSVSTVYAEREASDNFLWKQCDEDVLIFYLDPEPFAQRLPEEPSRSE